MNIGISSRRGLKIFLLAVLLIIVGSTTLAQSDDAKAHNDSGTVYYNHGEIERAIEEFSKAIELKPDYVDAFDFQELALVSR